MAQTGSAQREPSMEEILASIRRIIEDSDTVRSPAEAVGEPDEMAAAMPTVDAPVPEEVDAFRAELVEDAPEPAAVSMAEIQASVSTAPEAVDHTTEPASAAPWTAQVHPLRSGLQETETADTAEPDVLSHQETADADDYAADVDAPAAADVDADIDGVVTAIASGPRPAIISDQTGRQVAAAFGELSEAFAASRKRSFDEMAEEMLRPMLQDWLDNNLPTLVEKLVREEIERVARGG